MGISRLGDTYLNNMPIGTILPWPDATSIPPSYLKADGTAVSRTAYATAYDWFGTAWGVGDGSTTFNLPNHSIDTLPWNKPRGRVGYATKTSSQTGITTVTDITGLSVTFNQVANRRYKITLDVIVSSNTNGWGGAILITDGANTQLQGRNWIAPNAAVSGHLTIEYHFTAATTASATYKGRAVFLVGGLMAVEASSIAPGFISIEDLGADTSQSPWSTGCWIVKVSDSQPTLVGAPYEVVTSTTQPTGYTGKLIYETDTNNLLVHNGASYAKPWNMPWGRIAHQLVTSNTGSITTTPVDLMSVTFTAVAGRLYRIRMGGEFSSTVADGAFILAIADGSNNQVRRLTDAVLTTSSRVLDVDYITTLTAGSHTRKIRFFRASGSGTYTFQADATNPAYLLVEDIGPAS